MKCVTMLEVHQPVGTFYFGKMTARDVVKISKVSRRKGDHGHQRQLKESRIREISTYCQDPDATFPTPIIMSAKKDDFSILSSSNSVNGLVCFEYDESKCQVELLDGQHRIAGISNAREFDCELPIIIMFDLSEEQKAYVFSTINGNQVKVDRSLIYDLFDLNKTRSPYKTCHQIARALNSSTESPFYRRLKMLEKREYDSETISQGTFVTVLCGLISSSPQVDAIQIKKNQPLSINDNNKTVFRKYFIQDRDDVILKILTNYFSAAATVFEYEWNTPQKFVLTKTVGFNGLIVALKELVPIGEAVGDLSYTFFLATFKKVQTNIEKQNISITSEYFPTNAQGANKLSKMIIDAAEEIF